MTNWAALAEELDAWTQAGATASLWWRDDDAVTDTPALRRLIAATAIAGASLPLALAVIPAQADQTLVERVHDAPSITVLQHGWRHANNSAGTQKKSEFPPGRDIGTALDELHRGRERLAAMFGHRFLPMLVPPWNRIDENVVDGLGKIGIAALSTYGRRDRPNRRGNIRVFNTHVDIINWREDRTFMGPGACLAALIGHLRDRRLGRADRAEATGLLTHHLVQDEAAWNFTTELARRTAGHPAARWLGARQLVDA